jgi:hypothetical protein
MFQKKLLTKSKHKFRVQKILSENYALYVIMWKYGTAEQATDDNIIWCRKDAIYIPGN